jgi:hypothetical protein
MRFLASVFLCAFVPCMVSAQDTRGSISGTVTDSQAAVVSGASVIVANIDTGAITRRASNRSGYYEATLLMPGAYSITVEMAGFKKSVRTGVTLTLSEQLQINIQLEVGGVTESVTVATEGARVQTQSAERGRLSASEAADASRVRRLMS